MKHLIALALVALAPSAASAQKLGTIAAVNAPLAYVATVLGGDDIKVVYPVPADIDPAFWHPSPEDVEKFQTADLILLNGAGYAAWVKTAPLPRARIVDTTARVRDKLISTEGATPHKHGPEGEHAHSGAYAFTTWLDPEIATAQVSEAATAITERWPEMEAEVTKRAAILNAEIAQMDEAFSAYFKTLGDRQVFGSHPIYQYLDRAYVNGIVSLHWEPDTTPSPQEMSAFSAQLDADRDPIMLWEDTPLPETISALNDLGVEVIVLSPHANSAPGAHLFDDIAAQVR